MEDTQMEAVCEAIRTIFDRQESINDRLTALEKSYNEELLGSIKELYGQRVRGEGIEGLKGSYGEKYGSLADDYSLDRDGRDMWGDLYDAIADVEESERDPKVTSLLEAFKSRIEKLRGTPKVEAVSVSTEAPIEGPAEEGGEPAAETAMPEVPSMDDLIKNTIGKLKKRRGAGIMPGARED
jgi:hypothetical protein